MYMFHISHFRCLDGVGIGLISDWDAPEIAPNLASYIVSCLLLTELTLVPNTAGTICSSDPGVNGTKIRVYFQSELGDLPTIVPIFQISGQTESTLQFNNSKATSVTVYTDGQTIDGVVSIKGTTESNECSDRGICERETGLCHCFHGFGSSNGNGMRSKAGTRGDCGYVLPTFTVNE